MAWNELEDDDAKKEIRIPRKVKTALEVAAKLNGRSVNVEIRYRLEQSLKADGYDTA